MACLMSSTGMAASLRVGLLGPSREDAGWQFLKRGLAEANADLREPIEWVDVTAWRADPEAQASAAADLLEAEIDAVVVWPLVADRLAETRLAWLLDEIPVYSIANRLPEGEAVGHVAVDWTAFSEVVHVVAVDLTPRQAGVLVYWSAGEGPPVFSHSYLETFVSEPAWPATGIWRWLDWGERGSVERDLATVVVPDLRQHLRAGSLPAELRALPSVALALESYALTKVRESELDAIVVPQWSEAGHWLVARLQDRGGESEGFEARPLVVTELNAGWWRDWWLSWER